MPRYFFHLRNAEKALLDCDGMVLADGETACAEARHTVRDFFQPSSGRVAPEWEGWSLEVRDERGRCILLLPFAAAPELHELAPEAIHPPAPANVVHLDVARVRRELASLEAQMREVVRRTAALVDRNRYEAKTLYHMIQEAGETRLLAAQIVARSRQQTASGGA